MLPHDRARTNMPRLVLWLMLFTICFGLGYPTLNRYDTTQVAGLSDSLDYFHLVDGEGAAEGHRRYRVLVPYLARPISRAAVGHLGTWDPTAFGMLIVNSAFCASSGLSLIVVAQALGMTLAGGLIAAFCYLLNFNVANAQLAGLVDSAEFFLMTCLLLVLQRRWWNVLPVLGLLGGLAKETFVLLAVLFAAGWVWREKTRAWLRIGVMALAGMGSILAVRSVTQGRLVNPLKIAADERLVHGLGDVMRVAVSPLVSWVTWITFIWLVPFALRGVPTLPRAAIRATGIALAGAFALAVWNDCRPHMARPFFDVVGPCACLAFAAGVVGDKRRQRRAEGVSEVD